MSRGDQFIENEQNWNWKTGCHTNATQLLGNSWCDCKGITYSQTIPSMQDPPSLPCGVYQSLYWGGCQHSPPHSHHADEQITTSTSDEKGINMVITIEGAAKRPNFIILFWPRQNRKYTPSILKHRKNCECCPGHYLSTSVYQCLLVSNSDY